MRVMWLILGPQITQASALISESGRSRLRTLTKPENRVHIASGEINLYNGTNILEAYSINSYEGGGGVDAVVLSGSASGDIDLGDGENDLRAKNVKGVKGGSGNDTVILGGSADGLVDLGGGTNSLKAVNIMGYRGKGGNDTVTLWGDSTDDIYLGDGTNILKAANTTEIDGGSGADTVTLSGASDGIIDLKGGENMIRAKGAAGLEGGSGTDTAILTPGAKLDLGRISLGTGKNTLTIAGSKATASQVAQREASLNLSGGVDSWTDDTLHICNEIDSSDQCANDPEKTDYAFNVTLDASGQAGNTWETITVANKPSATQSVLTIKGEVKLTDSELSNLKVASDGVSGDEITIAGSFGITASTVFELDFDASKASERSDLLVFEAGASKMPQAAFISTPAIDIVEAASSGKAEAGMKVVIVRAKTASSVTDVDLMHAAGDVIVLNGQVWELGSSTASGQTEYYLLATSLPAPSAQSQSDGAAAAGGHALSAISAAASLPAAFGGRLGSGGGFAGVSSGRALSRPASLGTRLVSGSETSSLSRGSASAHRNSFRYLVSEAEVFARQGSIGRSAHFISARHGLVESDRLIRSSLSGVGYGFRLDRWDGGHFGLSASFSRMVTENLSGGLGSGRSGMSGVTLAAEAGRRLALGASLDVSATARIVQSRFGNASLPGGSAVSDVRKTTGEIGARLDYILGGAGRGEGIGVLERGVYGGLRLAHDFDAGYTASQGGASVNVDSSRDWVGLTAGVSWAFGGGGFFAEASVDSAADGLAGERRSYTLGYDLKW